MIRSSRRTAGYECPEQHADEAPSLDIRSAQELLHSMPEKRRTYCRSDGNPRMDTDIRLLTGRYSKERTRLVGIQGRARAVAASDEGLAYAEVETHSLAQSLLRSVTLGRLGDTVDPLRTHPLRPFP